MGSVSAETGTPSAVGRYEACRNLQWERSDDGGENSPGRYCVNRLGVVHYLDCPVYQGIPCCLFDAREEGETPPAVSAVEIEETRARLAEDYLRWPYWRRVETLRGEEAPGDDRRRVELVPEEPDDREEAEVEVAEHAPPPPDSDEEPAPIEKYPGQHRSEDRRKQQDPAPLAPLEEVLAEEPETSAPEPDESPADGAPEAEAKDEAAPGKKRSRRRRGRRRGRRRRKPPP
jgi:hypothetical protein